MQLLSMQSLMHLIKVATINSSNLNGINHGYPVARKILEKIEINYSFKIPATWFVRCDDEIEEITGERNFLLKEFVNSWYCCEEEGHEIGFHPHLYRRRGNKWEQDFRKNTQLEQLEKSWQAANSSGFQISSSRIGEAYCNNEIMKSLNDLGIKVDSTAMPGRVRKDNERWIDWEKTPDKAYKPSIDDYRVPGVATHSLTELPMSMLLTKAYYDKEKYSRYLDLSFHTECINFGINELVKNANTIVVVTHLSTLLQNNIPHGLISFDSKVYEKQLTASN